MGSLNLAALYLKAAVVTSDGCCSCPLNAGRTLPGRMQMSPGTVPKHWGL